MYQIDNSTAIAVIPASTAAGTAGFFTDGNPVGNVPATILSAEFMNMLMMEMLGVLSAAGITPLKATFNQLTAAIRKLNQQLVILADTGVAGTYTAVNVPALTALPPTGYAQWINIAHPNPGAATYAPDGLAAKPIYGLGLQALQGGELPVGLALLRYLVQPGVNGGNGAWIIMESMGGPFQVTPGSATSHMATVGQLQSGTPSFAVDTGTANTYVCAFTPAIVVRAEGQPLKFKVKNANTSASTFNDGLGAVALVGGAHAALQGGELIANGDAWVQWNTSIGGGAYILLFCTGAAEQVAPATQSQQALPLGQAQSMFSAPVGTASNVKMTVAAASATATMTADEIIVGTALGGQTCRVGNYNKSINLTTTGAGGMDTGTAPVSGWVALYAIYNPAMQTQGILAVNSPNTMMPAVYGGANMPAGYTASALLTVVPTNASGQFKPVSVKGRDVTTQIATLYAGSAAVSNNPISISGAIPANALSISGELSVGSSALSYLSLTLMPDASQVGQQNMTTTVGAGQSLTLNYANLPINTAQQIMFTSSSTAGTPNFYIYSSGYRI